MRNIPTKPELIFLKHKNILKSIITLKRANHLSLLHVSHSKHRLNIRIIMLILAMAAFATGIQRTVLSSYTGQLSTGIAVLLASGIGLVIYGSAKSLGNIFGGFGSERIGRKITMIYSTVIIFIASGIIFLFQNLTMYLIGLLFLGVGTGLLFASASIALSDLYGINGRTQAFSSMELAVYSGTAAGSYLAGTLSAGLSFSLVFVVSLVVAAFSIFVVFYFIRDTSEEQKLEVESMEISSIDIKEQIKKSVNDLGLTKGSGEKLLENINYDLSVSPKKLRKLLLNPTIILTFTLGTSTRLFDTIFIILTPLYLSLKFSENIFFYGTLNTIFLLAWGLGILVSPYVVNFTGRKFPVVFGFIIQGIALFMIETVPVELMVMISVFFAGFGIGLYYPLGSTITADLFAPDQKGIVVGIYRLFLDGGYLVGFALLYLLSEFIVPAITPNLSTLRNYSLTSQIVAGVLITIGILQFMFMKDTKPVWGQLPLLVKHAQKARETILYSLWGILSFLGQNNMTNENYIAKAKKAEREADILLDNLTHITYMYSIPRRDAVELLNTASLIDKSAGRAFRALKRINLYSGPIGEDLKENLIEYSILLLTQIDSFIKTIETMNHTISLTGLKSQEVSLFEEMMDKLYENMWNEIKDLHIQDLFDFRSLTDTVDLLEKSANIIEDAGQLVKLLTYKYYV